MIENNSTIPDEWLELARADLRRSNILLDAHDWAGAAFHLQQAVEKLLKGCLLRKGGKLKRTHDLEVLLDDLSLEKVVTEKFRPICRDLTYLYVATRYPGRMPRDIDIAEVREWRRAVAEMFDVLSGRSKQND